MRGTCVVEVGYKPGMADSAGRSLREGIRHLGQRGIKKVTTSQLYRLVGGLSAQDRERIAKDLLCDPIVQEVRDAMGAPDPKARRAPCAVVDVWYKSGVTDVVGESVLKGIRDLQVTGVQEVRTGLRYRLWGLVRAEPARRIASALLANPLVHDSFIHVD